MLICLYFAFMGRIIGFQDVAAWKGMNKLPHYFSELAMARENRLKNNVRFFLWSFIPKYKLRS